VRRFALAHAQWRHRELAWRMVDQDVVYLSPSTVYRILRAENLVCPWRRRTKRIREEDEKAVRPDERWATDLRYVWVATRFYFLITFIDEYSRYIVYHELLANMEGHTLALAAQAAIERLATGVAGRLRALPEIKSDNGSGYISREFAEVLSEHGLTHRRIKPHCPEENGVAERVQRTLGEAFEGDPAENYAAAVRATDRIVDWYNEDRLHSALGFLRPVDYYRGDPAALQEVRRQKLAAARHRRRETNLKLAQRTLPLEA